MSNIAVTSQVCKRFKKHMAVDHVDLHIREGEIYGLIGKNGAGKSTLLKMMAGLITPTEGEIRIAPDVRIGAMIENPGLHLHLSACDNLKLKCMAMGIRDFRCVPEILQMVGLSGEEKKKAKSYSLGMKQRLGIALAMIGMPDLIILDEPVNGLDPQGIQEIRQMILTLNRERKISFLISSHILEELGKVATTFGFMNQGRLIQELSREELMRRGIKVSPKEREEQSLEDFYFGLMEEDYA